MSEDNIGRKRKLRGAHRASSTRLRKSVSDLLASFDTSSLDVLVPKLNQFKISIQEKLQILRVLDNDIIDLVDEDNIDKEVEECDICRETLQLTLENIERTLINLPSITSVTPVSSVSTSPVSSPASTLDQLSSDTISVEQASQPSTSTATEASSNVGTLPGPTENSSQVPGHSTAVPVNPMHGNNPVENTPIQPVNNASRVKLPKLFINKFSGDPSKWNSFWDTFEASVHNNSFLAPIDKFNYLKSYMEGAAAESIEGLSLTNANYEEAITILKSRFGNKQQIINRHMNILLNLPSVSSENNVKGLRQLHDTVQSNIRSLKNVGVTSESYGYLLCSMLMSKLPSSLQLVVSRAVKEYEWNLDKLLDSFKQELEARERIAESTNKEPKKNHGPGSAASLTTGSHLSCTYCKGSHPSKDCTTVANPTDRQNILRNTGRCFVCLRKDHKSKLQLNSEMSFV